MAILPPHLLAQSNARPLPGPDLRQSTTPPPAGSLIIADYFKPDDPDHGHQVAQAARQTGFKGPIYTLQQNGAGMASRVVRNHAEKALNQPCASPESTLTAISIETTERAAGFLRGQTHAVDSATASGAKNSVLNLSMGTSKANLVEDLYTRASDAWNPKASPEERRQATVVANNYASAFDLNPGALMNQDPKISGPERRKLQQALTGVVDRSLASPEVRQASQGWSTSVRRFESNNNSVVIAAGNEGNIGTRMALDAGGRSARFGTDFEDSLLEIPEVTSVGATTRKTLSDGTVLNFSADYSNKSRGVDMVNNGDLDLDGDGRADTKGTSYAAPRTGAMMAELHGRHQNHNSAQIESMARNTNPGSLFDIRG